MSIAIPLKTEIGYSKTLIQIIAFRYIRKRNPNVIDKEIKLKRITIKRNIVTSSLGNIIFSPKITLINKKVITNEDMAKKVFEKTFPK